MKRIIHLIKQFDLMISVFKPAFKLYIYVVIGIIVGMLTVYILVPVKFRNNAVPVQLDAPYRDQWIKDTANSYQYILEITQGLDEESQVELQNRAETEAKRRLVDVGATTEDIDRLIKDNSSEQYLVTSLDTVRTFANDKASQEKRDQYSDPGFFTNVIMPIIVFLLVTILGLLAIVYYKLFGIPFLRPIKRLLGMEKVDPAYEAELRRRSAMKEESQKKTEFDSGPPVVQFMSTYLAGDNYYDDSFAIELEDNTFLGECGSGISDTIGVGEPKKVTATEVWMFDKNDISTITYVIMSEHAYHDEAIRAKLGPRGEAILAKQGGVTRLETQTLRAEIRIKSLEYGPAGPLPANSYFERLTVEIAVWQKEDADGSVAGNKPEIDFAAIQPLQPAVQAPPSPQVQPQPVAQPPQGQPLPPQQQPPQGYPQAPQYPQQQGQPLPPQQRPPQGYPQAPQYPQQQGQPLPPQQRPPQGYPQAPQYPQQQGQPLPPQQRPPQGYPQAPQYPQQQGQPLPPQQRPPQQGQPLPPPQRPPSPFGDTGEIEP